MPEHPESPETPHQLPQRTTPTWEMELLLSGATVFALFQAAGSVLAGGSYLMPRLDGTARLFSSLLMTYAHGALLLLVMTFALHLVVRAYWVALVGIHSVFPGGARFDRVNAGPVARELLRRRWQAMPVLIERADNRATVIFGVGVSVALVIVPVTLLVVVMFALSWLVGLALGGEVEAGRVFVWVMLLWFLPFLAAAGLDKLFGHRLVPGSTAWRACLAVLGFYARLGMGRDYNPLVTTFNTNIGERKGTAIVLVVMLVAFLGSFAGLLLSRQELGLGSYAAFPDVRRGMPASTHGRHYASSHDQALLPSVPFVPDPVARGPYLRLVVPYFPDQYGPALERCEAGAPRVADAAADPAADPAAEAAAEAARRQALLACFASTVKVSLNDKPVLMTPEWYTDPRRDLRGLLYMVPIRDLPPGRHLVSVAPPAGPGDPAEAAYLIPFWR